jgi:hypothetical protein
LFTVGETEDAKWRRFISHFGFEPLMPVVCENGQNRMMFISKVQ